MYNGEMGKKEKNMSRNRREDNLKKKNLKRKIE